MGSKLRKTGVSAIGIAPWGTHFCLFYKTKEDLIDILAPYFKAGLENNEFCMWVTSKPLSEKEAKEAMREAVPKFDQYLKRGQIEIVSYTKWYLKDGTFNLQRVLNAWIDKLNQALAKGYDGIRVTGNTAWLEKSDWKSFADYEKEVNKGIDKYRMLAICTYSLDKCGASEIIDVVSHHQFALIKRQGDWKLIESSEHKRMEEALRESEERYKFLVDNSKEIILILSKRGKILFANRRALTSFGYSKEEIIGKSILHFLTKDSVEKALYALKQEFLGYPQPEMEVRVKTKSGETRYLEVAEGSTPVYEKGKMIGVMINAYDITERKQAEKALRESEAKYRVLVEASNDGIISMDERGKIISWNKAAEQMFGYQRAKILGKPVTMLMPEEYRKRHREAVRSFLEKPRKLKRTIEVEALKKNGERFPVELSFSAHKGGGGDTLTFIAIVRDITEKKEKEEQIKFEREQLLSIFESIDQPVYVIDPETYEILYVNQALKKIFGKNIIGKKCYEIFQGLNKPCKFCTNDKIFGKNLGKTYIWDFQNLVNKRWYRCIDRAIKWPDGRAVRYEMAIDITERKRMEEALRESEELFRFMAETTGDVLYRLRYDTMTFDYLSPAISKLTGYSANEINQLGFASLLEQVVVDRASGSPPEELARRRMQGKTGEWRADYRLRTKTGELRWISDHSVPWKDDSGKTIGSVGVLQDITERKRMEEALRESEERYRITFESTGTATVIIEEDTTLSLVNSEFEKLSGYSKEEIEGKMSWAEFVVKEDLDRMKGYHRMRRIDASAAPSSYEFRFIDRQGNVRDILLTIAVIPGTKKSIASLLDITERKQAEKKIRASLKEKEVLLKEIHHRVKNNLQIISSLLRLQAAHIENKQSLEMFNESQNRIKSLALIHERLYQSHDIAKVDFAKYVRSLTSHLFSSYGSSQSIKLTINIKDVLLGINTAIPCGLIINELVSNSLKHGFSTTADRSDGGGGPPRTEGRVNEISIRISSDRKDKFTLIVSDNGVGFPKDVDFRNTETLGLQLVNTLVEQLDGTIELDRNNGTTFKIEFRKPKYEGTIK